MPFVDLRADILAHYQEVVAIVFQYIDLLKKRTTLTIQFLTLLEPVSIFKVIWEELKAMDEAHFRFAEKDQPSEFCSSTATSMQRCYPPDWVLSARHLVREACSPDNLSLKLCLV